jgi:hypothetical protein
MLLHGSCLLLLTVGNTVPGIPMLLHTVGIPMLLLLLLGLMLFPILSVLLLLLLMLKLAKVALLEVSVVLKRKTNVSMSPPLYNLCTSFSYCTTGISCRVTDPHSVHVNPDPIRIRTQVKS